MGRCENARPASPRQRGAGVTGDRREDGPTRGGSSFGVAAKAASRRADRPEALTVPTAHRGRAARADPRRGMPPGGPSLCGVAARPVTARAMRPKRSSPHVNAPRPGMSRTGPRAPKTNDGAGLRPDGLGASGETPSSSRRPAATGLPAWPRRSRVALGSRPPVSRSRMDRGAPSMRHTQTSARPSSPARRRLGRARRVRAAGGCVGFWARWAPGLVPAGGRVHYNAVPRPRPLDRCCASRRTRSPSTTCCCARATPNSPPTAPTSAPP